MELLNFFAMGGMTINDLISIFSVVGSFMLLVGAFQKSSRNRFGQFADWSILGLVFGGGSQIAMAITGTTPDKIGIVIGMSPALVNGLLLFSLLMLSGGWWVKRKRRV